jgi:O-antigen/teichoic acid export membrane protein
VTKKEIRTQYSGFILFTAKLLTVATGIAFTLMIARSVTQSEYGVYGTLNIIIPYFTILSTAIPFWVMRFVARDKEGAAKTGIVANTVIAAIAMLVYAAFFPLMITTFRLEGYIMLCGVAVAQIIEFYLIAVLEACLQAQRPHFVGYGLLVGEICKVTLAYIFIIELELSLLGAILSIIIALAIRIAFYFKTIWKELQAKIAFSYTKEWIKGSAFNIYNIIGDRIAAILFLMIPTYGGEIATSYYQAAVSIANIVTYSSFIAYALYPKLLAENTIEDATISLKMVLMFAIPMTIGALAIPQSYLIILKDVYTVATPILVILTLDALILTISSIFSTVLFGIEKVDEKAKIAFKQVAKSRLFIVFSLPYVHSLITLPTAFYILTNFTKNQPLLVATYVTAINTATHLVMFIVVYTIVRKNVKVEIPWRSIAKYIFASIFMAIILIAVHPTRLILTLSVTAVGGIVYLALLMLIDRETRTLATAVLQEIRKR